jgi:hypothetical protein
VYEYGRYRKTSVFEIIPRIVPVVARSRQVSVIDCGSTA